MLNFLSHFWFWLLVCLVVGLATGALVRRRPAHGGLARWLVWTSFAFLAGIAAAGLGVLPGAAGVYLESALGCYATFLVGAALGARLSGGSFAAHEGWALGLLPVVLVWWGATQGAIGAHQADLQRRVDTLARAAGVDATGLAVSGRDVGAPAAVAGNAALMAQIAAAPGVRRVVALAAPTNVPPPAPPEVARTPVEPPSAPPPEPADPRAVLAALPADALDAAACQRALDAIAAVERVEFREGSATIRRRAALALDKAAELIRRCPDVTIEVRGHADHLGADDENEALSIRRAQAAARYLRREGLAGRRLVVAGHGAHRAKAEKADERAEEERRAKFRTIDFAVQ